MSPFDDLKEKFSYKEDSSTTTNSSHIRKSIIKRQITKPQPKSLKSIQTYEKYKHLIPLPDILEHDLRLVFVGYNPSIRSSELGHRYAHPSNNFWKLIYESGIVDRKVTCYDDFSLLKDFRIGFTELIERPTKSIDEIPRSEMRRSAPILIKKVNEFKPKVVCIVGKGIWEHMEQVLDVKRKKKAEFSWGLQEQYSFTCKVFVVPSTSGLVRIPKEEMLKLWVDLRELISGT